MAGSCEENLGNFDDLWKPLSVELSRGIKIRLEKLSDNLSSPDTRGFVYLKTVPNNLKILQIERYFSKFGPVKAVKLIGNRKKKNYITGLVEFHDPLMAKVIGNHMNGCQKFLSKLQCSYLDEQILHNQIFKGANKKLKGNVTSSKSKVLYLDRKLKEKLKMMEDLGISLQLHLPIHNGPIKKRKRKRVINSYANAEKSSDENKTTVH